MRGNPLQRETPYKGKSLRKGNPLEREIHYKGKHMINKMGNVGKVYTWLFWCTPIAIS